MQIDNDRPFHKMSSKSEHDYIELDEKTLQECAEIAETYVANCKKFDVVVDPSVVIALRTGWSVLKPSKVYGEGSLLPLMDILADNRHIRKVNNLQLWPHPHL